MRRERRDTNRPGVERPSAERPAFNPSRLLLLVVLVLAAFLRFHRLDAQSFWNDEGNAARIAERPVALIIEGAAGDIHPPGYYLLLHVWRAAFGQSELALRSLSVVAGLALVACTYLLGRLLFNEAVALIAAFLGAISPFGVYYSQEARMYALLGALSAWSALLVARILQSQWIQNRSQGIARSDPNKIGVTESDDSLHRHRLRGLVPFGVFAAVGAAGLYTHYAFAFVLVAHNVAFGIWWLVERLRVRPRWRALAAWAGAQMAVLLVYLPWLPQALDAVGWSSAGGGYQLGLALLDVFRVLTVGITLPLGDARMALVVVGILGVIGLVPRWNVGRHRQRTESARWLGIGLLLVTLSIPLVLFFGFDLYKPAWLKFLVVILAPFHILVARGAHVLGDLISRGLGLLFPASSRERLSRPDSARPGAHGPRSPDPGQGEWSPRGFDNLLGAILNLPGHVLRFTLYAFVLSALAVLTFPSLRNLYFNPAYFRDDYRQLAADIQAARCPEDAVVLNAPNQWEVFTYYAPDEDVYPAPYHPSAGKAGRFLTPILEAYERIFAVYWGDAESDPRKQIETWLAEHAYKTGDRWYGDVRLAIYDVAPLPEEPQVTLEARFGDSAGGAPAGGDTGILLHGYALAERGPFFPGDVIPVTLFWQAESLIEEPYKVTIQLLDDGGNLSAQIDTVPRDGLAPTRSWEAGRVLTDRYGLRLPPELLPGRYSLIVAVYHAATGERLSVAVGGEAVGDYLALRDVTVEDR